MDTRVLFKKISEKMLLEFDASAQIVHSGSRGTIRENHLRKFLSDGRMPIKYGLGSGEIVGRTRDTRSKQCDVVIYDALNGVALLYDESIQAFPVDSVYGIIEVKSSLSKTTLLDALENIKSFKSIFPGGTISRPLGGGLMIDHQRQAPFGVIFAYNLSNNSLDSLVQNLREWESVNSPNYWPNYICVLHVGTIEHRGNGPSACHDSNTITSESWPISLAFKEDSLFKFYCCIHDMCSRMQLGPVELNHYYDPAIKIGKYTVYGRGSELQFVKNGVLGEMVHLRESSIKKIVSWCAAEGAISYQDSLLKRLGSLPLGTEGWASLKNNVFLYNPDNLPGLHELGQVEIIVTDEGAQMPPTIANSVELTIDGELYIVSLNGFTENDYES